MDNLFESTTMEHPRLRLREAFAPNLQSSGNASWASLSRTEWLNSVRKRLAALVDLPQGWDGYGAPKIAAETALFAAQILQDIWKRKLDAPDISAMSNGGLMIEIIRNDFELTIEVNGPYSTSFIFTKPGAVDDENGNVGADLSPLHGFVDEMIQSDVVVPLVA